MSKRSIKLSLSPSAIDKFIQEELIIGLQLRAKDILNRVLEDIANESVKIVKSNIQIFVNSQFSTGELERSVQAIVDLDSGKAIIRVNAYYGAYVEFGTGVVGSNRPHSSATEFGWKYDVNAHGELGWVYKKGEDYFWSKGQPSSPFMSLSSVDIADYMNRLFKAYENKGGK